MVAQDKSKQEYDFYKQVGDYYSKFFLFFNKIEYFGLENIIKDKSAIIAPNHIGSTKDIFALYEIFKKSDTQLFFLARSELFKSDKLFDLAKRHLAYHTKVLASLIPDWRLYEFAEFGSSSLERIDTISCEINHNEVADKDKEGVNKNKKRAGKNKQATNNAKQETEKASPRAAINKMIDYVANKGRKIVVFQYDDEKRKLDQNASFHGAKKGAPIAANSAYKDYGVVVPIYPVAILGSKGLMPWYMVTELRRKPIKVSIGKPLEITSFINEKNPVESMRAELESRIWYLLRDLGKREDKGQILYPSKDFGLRDFFSTLLTKGEKRNLIYPGQYQS